MKINQHNQLFFSPSALGFVLCIFYFAQVSATDSVKIQTSNFNEKVYVKSGVQISGLEQIKGELVLENATSKGNQSLDKTIVSGTIFVKEGTVVSGFTNQIKIESKKQPESRIAKVNLKKKETDSKVKKENKQLPAIKLNNKTKIKSIPIFPNQQISGFGATRNIATISVPVKVKINKENIEFILIHFLEKERRSFKALQQKLNKRNGGIITTRPPPFLV